MIRADILSADREIVFACGHATTKTDWIERETGTEDEAVQKFWIDQTMPLCIAAVAPCPLCKGPRGKSQLVTAVNARVTLPPEQRRLS